MALRKRPLAACLSAFLFSGYVSALGLGEINLNSALNEPLDAEIPLLNLEELSEAEIIAGLASGKDFANAGVERDLLLSGLVFKLDLSDANRPLIRVTSQKPIREPYLDFLVDVQWPAGRLLREYTLLLDMPVYAGGSFSKKKPSTPVRPAHSTSAYRPPAPSTAGSSSQTFSAGSDEYLVKDGDTLWGISRRLSGDAPIHQKLSAIHQLNPEAFINGDINLLKRGAVLRLPEYSSPTSGQGVADVSGGNEYGAPLSASSRQGSYAQPTDNAGRLSLSADRSQGGSQGASPGAPGTAGSGVRGEIAAIQEELDRSKRENVELRQRLSALENQLGTMHRLLELEDDNLRASQLAALQEQAQDAEPVAAEDESFDPVDEVVLPEAFEQDSPSLALFPSANERRKVTLGATGAEDSADSYAENSAATEELTEQDESQAVDFEQEVQQAGAEEVADAGGESDTAKSVTSPMTMEINTDKGWTDKVSGYLTYILGLLIVAIGLVVFFVLRRGKKEETYEDIVDDFSPPPPSPVRTRPVEEQEIFEPQPTSIDEIDLKEEDDLFAEPEAAPQPAQPTARTASYEPDSSASDIEDELAEVDLEEFSLPEEPAPAAAPAKPVEDLNLDEEFDFLGDVDEGDTQLELAQAYMEMGDQSGAREILLEVIEDGTDEQKAKARNMLEQLG